GRYADAKKAADQLAAHVGPQVPAMPMLEGFMPVPVMTLVRFQKWDEVLRQPDPASSMGLTRIMWHLARGMAFAGKGDTGAAETERLAFEEGRKAIPADAMYSPWNKA